MNFICSCMVDTIRSGGSALVPIGRIGVMLQLLEEISQALEALELKVYFYLYFWLHKVDKSSKFHCHVVFSHCYISSYSSSYIIYP